MARDIPAPFLAALAGAEITPFFAVDLMFQSGAVYLWSGYGDLYRTDTANTYLGAGQLLNISTVEETTEIQAVGANFTLSGIPSDFLSLALQEPYQGRECRIYFGSLVTGVDPSFLEIFSGEMDQMNIIEASDTCTISVSAENALIKLDRPVIRRLTNTDQQSRYPNDKGLEYVASLQDKEIYWGRKGDATQSNSSPSWSK